MKESLLRMFNGEMSIRGAKYIGFALSSWSSHLGMLKEVHRAIKGIGKLYSSGTKRNMQKIIKVTLISFQKSPKSINLQECQNSDAILFFFLKLEGMLINYKMPTEYNLQYIISGVRSVVLMAKTVLKYTVFSVT